MFRRRPAWRKHARYGETLPNEKQTLATFVRVSPLSQPNVSDFADIGELGRPVFVFAVMSLAEATGSEVAPRRSRVAGAACFGGGASRELDAPVVSAMSLCTSCPSLTGRPRRAGQTDKADTPARSIGDTDHKLNSEVVSKQSTFPPMWLTRHADQTGTTFCPAPLCAVLKRQGVPAAFYDTGTRFEQQRLFSRTTRTMFPLTVGFSRSGLGPQDIARC